ncbi:MAG: sulfite exporter TauE/SafE family protein [Acidimicrobiales bacterium]
MSITDALLVILAGIGAGAVNAIVGSGTLITFPTLLLIGISPVTANVSNSLGLIPGSLAGAIGYRREVRELSSLVRHFAPLSVAGAAVGAVLLLRLDPDVFGAVVPVLVMAGIALVITGPYLQRRVRERPRPEGAAPSGPSNLARLGIFCSAIYGGYFGAAQGIIVLGLLGVLMSNPVQQLNGLKNVLVMLANAVAAVVFLLVAPNEVNWAAAGLIAIGSAIGGTAGAAVGRHLPPNVLRGIIVIVGLIAVAKLLTS